MQYRENNVVWVKSLPHIDPSVKEFLVALDNRMSKRGENCIYVTGGFLRDILIGCKTRDIDITISHIPADISEMVSGKNVHLVSLDKKRGYKRIVFNDWTIDITPFYKNSLYKDLERRDFTINAMATPLKDILKPSMPLKLNIIDPFGGLRDLYNRSIRMVSMENMKSDPIRILRAVRLSGALSFSIEKETKYIMKEISRLIENIASERIRDELLSILKFNSSHELFYLMDELNILSQLIPQIDSLRNIGKGGYHHLPVWEHTLLSLENLEDIINNFENYFPRSLHPYIADYLHPVANQVVLKLAVIFHDIGKSNTYKREGDKITFYGHQKISREIFLAWSNRYKIPKGIRERAARLISYHMRPFHLLESLKKGVLTNRGIYRIARDLDDDIDGLFILALADLLSMGGPMRPKSQEALLIDLYSSIRKEKERAKRLEEVKRLINGHKIIKWFNLTPGPIIGKLLEEVQELIWIGELVTESDIYGYLSARLKGKNKMD